MISLYLQYLKAVPHSGIAFSFLRAWCNGSIRVSKTFDLGSNPSARAVKFENEQMC
jgi:hypothetical protein